MSPAIIMIGYMALTIGIGLYLTKNNKSIQEFFVAKRGLGVTLIIPLLFAELIAGAGTIGNAAEAFKMGFSSVWANWGMSLGCLLFIIFATKFFRVMGAKFGVMSVPEAYKNLFDAKTRLVMLFIVCLVYGILFAQQPTAAASIMGPMFNANTTLMTWVIAIIFIIMTLTGGLKGLAWMNVVHSFVMYFGMGIAAWFCVNHAGGFGQLQATLPATFFSFTQPNFSTVLAWAFGTAISFLCAATVVGVCFGAKSLKTANTGIILGAILVMPFALMPALIGMAAKVHMPTLVAKNALFSISAHVGPWIGGLTAMAIIAAIFSTAPALLLIVSTTLTRDFYKGFVNTEATDAQQLRFSQVTILVIGVIATYLGMQASSILGQMLGAFQIRSVAGVVLAVALIWPRVNSTAAFWSILLGGGLAAVWHFAGSPLGIAPLWPSLGVGLVLLIGLTLVAKEPVSEGYKRYQTAVKEAQADGTI